MAGYKGLLGVAALCYIAVDYLRVISPSLHSTLQPLLWGLFAVAAASRAPFYPYWSTEVRSVLLFLGSLIFMLSSLVVEAIAVQFVTSVLGLDWHWSAHPLPDTGQWIFLSLNEKLPNALVNFLRAPLIGLHHYLMLFIMLGFSVLFGCIKAPGLGLGARYMFTMGIGRLLRVLTFVGTILPSARPWCARTRFLVPKHPHPWAQTYYMPYADNPDKVYHLLQQDKLYAQVADYPAEYVPDWGWMQFLVNFLRPVDPKTLPGGKAASWFSTLKRAGGGCNDLVYSGHILVSVLTAMAWTEAYPGWTSVSIWLLVLHSAQREIRERHHYTIDVVAGIYVGIMLWRTTSFIWSKKDGSELRRLKLLEKIEGKLMKASKDGNLDEIRKCLEELHKSKDRKEHTSKKVVFVSAALIITISLGLGLLAFVWTADG